MLLYLGAGAILLALVLVVARWYVRASPSDLAQAARTFIAVFSGLAGTGLLFMGRFGLAIVTLGATVMAVRALLKAGAGADPMGEAGRGPAARSSVETDYLAMELDRQTGDLDGTVRQGSLRGSRLSSLPLESLLGLLTEAQRVDQASVALLETYLDRTFPDWHDHLDGHDARNGAGDAAMDERTALAVLGVGEGATIEEIRNAHRRLMAKIHPDHGGSDYLASQINRAKDMLLRHRRSG